MLDRIRLPFTFSFLVTMILANYGAGTFGGGLSARSLEVFGFGARALSSGEVWRFATAIFLSRDPGMLLRQLLFAASVIGAYEWREGWRDAAGMFFSTDLLASAATALALLLALGLGAAGHGLAAWDVGMSGGGFGLIGALVAGMRRRRGIVLSGLIVALAAKAWIDPEPVADLLHPVALFVGYALHRALNARRARRRRARDAA